MKCDEAIIQKENNVIIKIHVTPKSSQSLFPVEYNKWRKCIEINVTSEAQGNKANKEIIKNIAKYFNILQKNISIISGVKSREKSVLLKNIQRNDIINKIEDSLNGL